MKKLEKFWITLKSGSSIVLPAIIFLVAFTAKMNGEIVYNGDFTHYSRHLFYMMQTRLNGELAFMNPEWMDLPVAFILLYPFQFLLEPSFMLNPLNYQLPLKLFACFFDSLIVFPMFALAGKITEKESIKTVVAFLTVFSPMGYFFVRYLVLKNIVGNVFLITSIYFFQQFSEGNKNTFLFAVFAFLTALTHTVSFACLIIIVFIQTCLNTEKNHRKRLMSTVLILAFSLLILILLSTVFDSLQRYEKAWQVFRLPEYVGFERIGLVLKIRYLIFFATFIYGVSTLFHSKSSTDHIISSFSLFGLTIVASNFALADWQFTGRFLHQTYLFFPVCVIPLLKKRETVSDNFLIIILTSYLIIYYFAMML